MPFLVTRLMLIKPKSRLKQVISACGLDETIEHLPDGSNALLTNYGTNLSGGQKQKLQMPGHFCGTH